MHTLRIVVASIGLGTFCCAMGLAQELKNVPSDVAAENATARLKLDQSLGIIWQRERAITHCFNEIETNQGLDQTSRLRKEFAIRALGTIRATEAVYRLRVELSFEGMDTAVRRDPFNSFPVAVALLQIGEPSVREFLNAASEGQITLTDLEERLWAWIIYRVYEDLGRDVAIARVRRTTDHLKHHNSSDHRSIPTLEHVMKHLATIDIVDQKTWPRPTTSKADKDDSRK